MIVDAGNKGLERLDLGQSIGTTRAARPRDIPELDQFHKALHNATKVAAGDAAYLPPARLSQQYRGLRDLMDWESAFRLDFDPEMATVEDYFYRGWKAPKDAFMMQRGRLVTNPAFKKPRVGASYEEMRELGFEPQFWNPYEQWRVARMQGVRYRNQMDLVEVLKQMGDDVIRPDQGGPLPSGWRVPQVGPAFEGKPFATMDKVSGQPRVMYTRRWITRNEIANMLENAFGKKPDMGKVVIGGRAIDLQKAVDWVVFPFKRTKLLGSLFQQFDFFQRGGGGAWHGFSNALRLGHPYEAVKHLALFPQTAADDLAAYFHPGWRANLRAQLDSTAPLLRERPGITMKGISEAGLSIRDVTILGTKEVDQAVRAVVVESGLVKVGKAAPRAILALEYAMRQGLFGGVYPAAIIGDVRRNIAPIMARTYPHLTDEQLMSMIAMAANKRYSTIPASQSMIQNRVAREGLTRLLFSLNENEALLRQPVSALKGHQKAFWQEHYLGMWLFLMAEAEVIHYAATGEHLPFDRFIPVSSDGAGPLPFGYNRDFASPALPALKGVAKQALQLDLAGQMDTVFRTLDPGGFVGSRFSVPIRAFVDQWDATNFYGRAIDTVGPGGVWSRAVQLARDLVEPIGIGQATTEILRETVGTPEGLVQPSEPGLGVQGHLLQATGMNLRQELQELEPFARYIRQQQHPDLANPTVAEVRRKRHADRMQILVDYPSSQDRFERWQRYRVVNEYWRGILDATLADVNFPKNKRNDPLTRYYAILDDERVERNSVSGQITRRGWDTVSVLRARLQQSLSDEEMDYLLRNIHIDPGPPELVASLPEAARADIYRSLFAQRRYIQDLMAQGQPVPRLPEFPQGTAGPAGMAPRRATGGMLAIPQPGR
jgi:hypothetical protein